MLDNFNVSLDIKKNEQDEVEVNGYTRRSLINNNLLGLSFYELACRPRQINETDKVSVDYKKIDRIIKEILRCNICLQIYHDPVNIKNCLHKFCKKCIEDYNRRIKKECALCRHQIETRRVMREDKKVKEISRNIFNLVNCLIPNIEKFNELEDKIITNYLPKFCFKDAGLKQLQQENNDKIQAQAIDDIPNNASYGIVNNNNNNNDLLQRKKQRKENNSNSKKKTNGTSGSELVSSQSPSIKSNNTVGVKLICDTPNEELKKYFSKTKLYTNDEISLDYFSKYICFKQNFPPSHKDKITFFIYTDENKSDKINLEKGLNLKEIKLTYEIPENDLLKLYFNINA